MVIDGRADADWICAGCADPVVQVKSPIVIVVPGARIMEAEKIGALLAMMFERTPPTWRATVDCICSAVYLGVYPR